MLKKPRKTKLYRAPLLLRNFRFPVSNALPLKKPSRRWFRQVLGCLRFIAPLSLFLLILIAVYKLISAA